MDWLKCVYNNKYTKRFSWTSNVECDDYSVFQFLIIDMRSIIK